MKTLFFILILSGAAWADGVRTQNTSAAQDEFDQALMQESDFALEKLKDKNGPKNQAPKMIAGPGGVPLPSVPGKKAVESTQTMGSSSTQSAEPVH